MKGKTNSGTFHSRSWQLLVGEITSTPAEEHRADIPSADTYIKILFVLQFHFPELNIWEMFVLVSKQLTKPRLWRFPNGATKIVGDINVSFIFLVNSYYFLS